MTNETLAAYEAYVTLGEQIKSLTDKRKKAQAVIKKYHETENLSVITDPSNTRCSRISGASF